MSKGISQTSGPQFVARGRLVWDHVFLGMLAKNVTAENSDGEVQFSLGGTSGWHGASLSSYIAYKRAITSPGTSDEQALEFGVAASRAWGAVTYRTQIVVSPNELGSATSSVYVEAGADWDASARAKIGASIGHRNRGNHVDYSFANIGFAYTLNRRFIAELRGYATNKGEVAERYKPRLVVMVRAKF